MLFILAASILCISPAIAATIAVPSGSSIQAGIDAAMDGDEVVVAPGTYYENLVIQDKSITLRSQNPSDPDVVSATIIDGGGTGTVVRFTGAGKPALKGFTITHGHGQFGGGITIGNPIYLDLAPTIANCVITGNTADDGAGIYASGPNLTLDSCLIENNTASGDGGGIEIFQGTATLTDCKLTNNTAQRGGAVMSYFRLVMSGCIVTENVAGSYSEGGGICAWGPLVMERCTVSGNVIRTNTGSMGAGISCYEDATIVNSVISDNRSEEGGALGAGIFCHGKLTLTGSVVTANSGGNGCCGGGISLDEEAVITNSVISGNTCGANSSGAGIFGGTKLTVINSTITGNSSDVDSYGAGIYSPFTQCVITNSILWADAVKDANGSMIADEIYPADSTIFTVTYSDVQISEGVFPGTNNINAVPGFVDPLADYHLTAASACIDKGNNLVEDLPATDLDGNPRIVNGVVDMGAYETKRGALLPAVNIMASDPTATEPFRGRVDRGAFLVIRTGDTSAAITVNYTVSASSTATSGVDYAALSGTVVIPAHKMGAVIRVVPLNDSIDEPNETVKVTLSAGAGYKLGPARKAKVTIKDND